MDVIGIVILVLNAARGGHLEVLKWARENGCDWNISTCSYAAEEDISKF